MNHKCLLFVFAIQAYRRATKTQKDLMGFFLSLGGSNDAEK